jgi:hypothetical protein
MVEKLFLLLKHSICKNRLWGGSNHVHIVQDSSYLTSVPPLIILVQLFKLKNQFTKHFNIFVKDV